ncbi:MAG: LysR family transcriptional regulator [Rhodoglobus sp.]
MDATDSDALAQPTPEDEVPRTSLLALHSFVAAAGAKSIREAAVQLNLSAPALNDRLRQLEKDLGVKLLESSNTGTKLSVVGREVLDYAQRVLKSHGRLSEFAKGAKNGTLGSLSIACYPVHVERLLGNVLGQYVIDHPGIRVDLSQMRDDRRRTWGRSLFEELRDGDVDLAIGPPHVGDEYGLSGFRLYAARIVAMLPDQHQLRREPSIQISALRGLPLLIAPEGFFSRERVREAARDAGFALSVMAQSSNPPALLALGSHGLGIPILPDDYPLVGQQRFPYPVIEDAAGKPIQTEVWIHWRTEAPKTRAVEAFLALVEQFVEREQKVGRKYEEYYRAEMGGFERRAEHSEL